MAVLRIDLVPRAGAAGRRAHQEVGPLRERDEVVEVTVRRFGYGFAVVIAEFHVEAARGAVRDLGSDRAHAEDTQAMTFLCASL